MNNAAGITRTEFGSEAVIKSEAALRNFETPFLRDEVPLVIAETGRLSGKCNDFLPSEVPEEGSWLHRHGGKGAMRPEAGGFLHYDVAQMVTLL